MDASPRRIMITGGPAGIGSALARRLVAHGGVGRSVRPSGGAAGDAGGRAGRAGASPLPGDAGNAEDLAGPSRPAVERFGRLDGLAHCVGSILLKPLHLTSPEEFAEAIHVNLTTAFLACRAVLGTMRGQNSGSIVLVSTVAVRQGLNNHETDRRGQGGRSRGWSGRRRSRMLGQDIRFNAVAPGMTETPLTAPLLQNDGAAAVQRGDPPARPARRPEDIAARHGLPARPGIGLGHRPGLGHRRRPRRRARPPPQELTGRPRSRPDATCPGFGLT